MATDSTSSTSSSTYSYLSSSSKRMSGLVSGMDIDSIVEKLMKAESAKMERLQQQKQKLEWQREAYRSVNTKLEAFRTDAFDKYGLTSNIISNKVSISNDSKVAATATTAASGTLSITEATVATAGSKVTTAVTGRTNETTLSSLFTGNELSTSAGTVKLKVYQQDGTAKDMEIEYTATDTLDSIASKINKQNAGVTALVGDNGQFSLTATATGQYTGGTIQVISDSNSTATGLFNKIGFTGTELVNGTDGSYTVNGIEKKTKSNAISVSGYNLTLKENIATIDKPVTISSTLDSDSVVDKVKSFIELYNGLITDLKSQVSTKKNVDYSPLTDAQKAEMTTEQIKTWEEKAKAGIIKGDTSITSSLAKMRSAISTIQVDDGTGKKISIFSIGIDTNTDGTLTIKDESKLKSAIEANPQGVANLFTQTSDTTSKKSSGIIESLRNAAKSAIDTITTKAGKESAGDATYSLGRTITSIEKQITDWKDRLKDIEDRYYSQFTAMETAINKANSQSSLFTA